MDKFVKDLSCQNIEEISKCLEAFCNTHGKSMKLFDSSENDVRDEIWRLLFEKLSDGKFIFIHEKCLETLRILSRDKTDLDNLVTDERLNEIINKANLGMSIESSTTGVIAESLKLICNLVYNSTCVQEKIVQTTCLPNLVRRISTYNDDTPYDTKLFDIRIIFLITAFNSKSRDTLKNELNTHDYLIDTLENLLSNQTEKNDEEKKKNNELSCEILKTLFNLFIATDDLTDKEQMKCKKIVDISYNLLTQETYEGKEELQNHVINLLTVIPSNCYDPIIKSAKNTPKSKNEEIFWDMDMSAISELLIFLDWKLTNLSNLSENILPVLTVLYKLSCSERFIRKYCRQKVLPPLKDVMKRPEEGTTLKANLCKLLVSPSMEIKNLVAEFLFVLCKENVSRMIKYTGYGNAAGMFANKGLLRCEQPQTDYSSDSAESDTEEYAKYKESINPVTGCYEKPRQNPLEGMTEEQKEYEVMKLVNLVNQLTNDGVVRPCTVGKDGKPKSIEHVLELQEGLKQPLGTNEESDSD